MKLLLTNVLLVLCTCWAGAQIQFEPGYLIDNAGKRQEVFIKNVDWRINPEKFTYKTSLDSKSQEANIKNIQEFGINGFSKYRRFSVKIDRSSDILGNLSQNRAPEYDEEEDTVFLKALLEGKAELYVYENKDYTRFFYRKQGGLMEPLVYKKYRIGQRLGENKRYRLQLWSELQCEGISQRDAENTDYKQKALINYFNKYNACFGAEVENIDFVKKEKRDGFNLYIRPGLGLGFFRTERQSFFIFTTGNFDQEISYRIGFEFEFVMPFNKNKWAFTLEPTYESYKADQTINEVSVLVDYEYLKLPLGLRYYSFLSDKSKLFYNVVAVMALSLDGATLTFEDQMVPVPFSFPIRFVETDVVSKMTSVANLALGLGYTFNNLISVEARYNLPRNLVPNVDGLKTDYSTFGLIVGINIF